MQQIKEIWRTIQVRKIWSLWVGYKFLRLEQELLWSFDVNILAKWVAYLVIMNLEKAYYRF